MREHWANKRVGDTRGLLVFDLGLTSSPIRLESIHDSIRGLVMKWIREEIGGRRGTYYRASGASETLDQTGPLSFPNQEEKILKLLQKCILLGKPGK